MHIRSDLRRLLQTQLGVMESVEGGGELAAVERVLADAATQRAASQTKLQQLEAAAQQLEQSKLAIEQLSAEQLDKNSTIKTLEQRIQELSSTKNVKLTTSHRDETLMPTTPARLSLSRSTTPSLGYKHPPPITPPPAVPPPPVPESASVASATDPVYRRPSLVDKHLSDIRSSSSATPEPRFPVGSSSTGHSDSPTVGQLHAQIEEQETMIRTLNKQLLHCETDLQAVSVTGRAVNLCGCLIQRLHDLTEHGSRLNTRKQAQFE